MASMTGLSGNEIYCMHLKGMAPGDLVLGNSVYSLGFIGSIGAGAKNAFGGEVTQITDIIHEGRQQSFDRMMGEAQRHGGLGVTGTTSELTHFHGNIEFLSVATCVHRADGQPDELRFSTAHDGQELYCQLDAGYSPIKSVFGNVAYSTGVVGGIVGGLKAMARGEIREFSDIFNQTRHVCLSRIVAQATAAGANSVVGIETTVKSFEGLHEMMMLGTASHNPNLPAECTASPVTSDMPCEEMWNLTAMGYMPVKLVMGTAVYSVGVAGGVSAMIKSFSRGEISELTSLVYDAREHALGLIHSEADAIGAEAVVGIKTYIWDLGGLLEFMAIGTAVRRQPGMATANPALPPQAIIKDHDTWIWI